MSIIRLADIPPRPWKNGRGATREIAIAPPSASMEDFLWRVSLAEVDSAAPFSAFPDVDRVIALLAGAGFTLTLDGTREHALDAPCVPFAFPGEAQVAVRLHAGPTRDFNLMLRRGRASGALLVERRPGTWPLAPDTVLVHCAAGRIECAEGALATGDSWLPAQPDTEFTLATGAVALLAQVRTGAGR